MRTKIMLAAILALVMTGYPFMAGAVSRHGISRYSLFLLTCHTELPAKVNIEQARLMIPESQVIVRGSIAQRISQDLYVFEDDSSSILVTIPETVRSGEHFSRLKLLELHGELTKSPSSVKIRVAKMIEVD